MSTHELLDASDDMARDQRRAVMDLLNRDPSRYPAPWSLVRVALARDGSEVERVEAALDDDAVSLLRQAFTMLASGGRPLLLDGAQEIGTQRAAALLGVSRPTIVAMIDRGELPARVVGKRNRRVKLADVLALRRT